MKHKWPTHLLVAIFTAVAVLTGVWWLPRITAGQAIGSLGAVAPPAQQAGPMVSGDYQGGVSLDHVYTGVFDTNPAATPSPIDLGQIDLLLHLEPMSNGKAGFVMLDRTLVFTREHQIMVTPVGPTPSAGTPAPTPHALDIGPYVNLTPDASVLILVSDTFTMTLNGREITRQFSLTASNVQAGGATLTGAYRETVWGYAPEPSTVIGSFTLQKPVFPTPGTPVSTLRIYLPYLRKP